MKEYYCSNCGKLFEENAVPSSCPDCGCPASEFKEKEITAVAPTLADTITEKKVDQDHVTPSPKSFKISLGFTIAGLILLVMTIVALLSNDVFSSTWNMVWLFFWLYMGAFGVYQMKISQKKSTMFYASASVLICLFFIVDIILYNRSLYHLFHDGRAIRLLYGLSYGLCMLLNSADLRGFAKYASAGCGMLWIISEGIRYSGYITISNMEGNLSILIIISTIVSIFVLLTYWIGEIKHSKQEKSTKYILSLIETISLIVTIVSIIIVIVMVAVAATTIDYEDLIKLTCSFAKISLLPLLSFSSIVSLLGSLVYSSKKYGYIFSAILFAGSTCILCESSNWIFYFIDGSSLIDFFRDTLPVLGSITLFSIIIFTMSCFVPNLKSKFNLKLK